jgi:hypothetical protein
MEGQKSDVLSPFPISPVNILNYQHSDLFPKKVIERRPKEEEASGPQNTETSVCRRSGIFSVSLKSSTKELNGKRTTQEEGQMPKAKRTNAQAQHRDRKGISRPEEPRIPVRNLEKEQTERIKLSKRVK